MSKLTKQQELIIKVCDEVKELLLKKNRDYDNSFSKQYAEYGLLSGVIRLEDKMSRIRNLAKGNTAQVDEKVDQTLIDLVGYGCLILVERSKEKELADGISK